MKTDTRIIIVLQASSAEKWEKKNRFIFVHQTSDLNLSLKVMFFYFSKATTTQADAGRPEKAMYSAEPASEGGGSGGVSAEGPGPTGGAGVSAQNVQTGLKISDR